MFHAKNGWFFKRLENGNVIVEKHQSADEISGLREAQVFTPHEWASIVAAVSEGGESDRRWFDAFDFHNGKQKCICPADGHSEQCPVHKVNSSPR